MRRQQNVVCTSELIGEFPAFVIAAPEFGHLARQRVSLIIQAGHQARLLLQLFECPDLLFGRHIGKMQRFRRNDQPGAQFVKRSCQFAELLTAPDVFQCLVARIDGNQHDSVARLFILIALKIVVDLVFQPADTSDKADGYGDYEKRDAQPDAAAVRFTRESTGIHCDILWECMGSE